MVQINFARKEVNCKLVYYGCGLSGKTTNLEVVHDKAPRDRKGELTSIATKGDRTLFFDFMPLDLGKVGGMNTKFQLYTVPGQVYYNATRKLVLQGADGVIFVADSQREKLEENLESWKNLEENLAEQGLNIRQMPVVIQYNKRDLPNAMSVEELDAALNPMKCPTFEAVALTGEGVFPTLKKLSSMVLQDLNKKQRTPAGASNKPIRKAGMGELTAATRSPTRRGGAPGGGPGQKKLSETVGGSARRLSETGALRAAGGGRPRRAALKPSRSESGKRPALSRSDPGRMPTLNPNNPDAGRRRPGSDPGRNGPLSRSGAGADPAGPPGIPSGGPAALEGGPGLPPGAGGGRPANQGLGTKLVYLGYAFLLALIIGFAVFIATGGLESLLKGS